MITAVALIVLALALSIGANKVITPPTVNLPPIVCEIATQDDGRVLLTCPPDED